jgi:type IV pilus assembly protein PilM
MPTQRAIVEFQENCCCLFVWEAGKGNFVLKSFLRIPLVKPEEKNGAAEAACAAAVRANAAALRQVIRAGAFKIREVLAVIPKQWVTVRVVTLPSTDPAELNDMARFEAQRYIPFNVERHIISHHILRIEGIEGSRVIVAAIDGPPAEEIASTLEEAGLRVEAFDVSTLALVNALVHSGQWDPEANPTVAQIDIGYTSTDINILHRGYPVFARSIATGVEKLLGPAAPEPLSSEAAAERLARIDLLRGVEEASAGDGAPAESPAAGDSAPAATPYLWAERLVNEVRRTYDFARREFECEPLTQVFVSGPGAHLGNLDQILRSNLGIEPVRLDPFGEFLRFDRESLPRKVSPSECVVGAGGLLRDVGEKAFRIDLRPPAYIEKHRRLRRRRSLTTTGALALLLVVLGIVFGSQRLTRNRRLLDFYEKQIAATEERAKDLRYRKTVIRILNANTSQQGSALAILNTLSGWTDLFNGVNMRISLEEFDYTARDHVTISGWAWDHKDLNDFVAKLETSGHFEKVRIEERPPSTLPGRPEQALKFRIKCVFARKEGPLS